MSNSIGSFGSTDTISALPMIACCIVASMTVVFVFETSISDENQEQSNILPDICQELLACAIEKMTQSSFENFLYLLPDWQNNAAQINSSVLIEKGISASIIVNILGLNHSEFVISGDFSLCRVKYHLSEPVLFAVEEYRIPAEIGVTVGNP